MKITVKELGILKQAEFEVGDLTIICGANNTGKTYATYALYGFLTFWNEVFNYKFIEEENIDRLLKQGSIKIDLDSYKEAKHAIVKYACEDYSKNIPIVFGASKKSFTGSYFDVSLDDIDFDDIDLRVQTKGPDGRSLCEINKTRGESELSIRIIASSEEINAVKRDYLLFQINHDIKNILFGKIFPAPFIASIERTGAAMFQKELDIYRNKLLEQVSNRDKELDIIDLLNPYNDVKYALPVRRDVDFIRDLERIPKSDGTYADKYPEILSHFDLLAGGEYRATSEGVYYVPSKSKAKLTMGESASSVRSLLNIGMYIRYMANPGDFLMIDEPELNLHPKNQRLMARLLAKLVNAGVRIFVTTHSDYIIKEFNTLMMMNNNNANTCGIMKRYGYVENELLDVNKVRAYIAKKDLIRIEGQTKKQRYNTFIQAPLDKRGMEIAEFDETINIMNEIQEHILYSGE